MAAAVVECVLEAGSTLGEGPVWDEQRNVLWWVDIIAGAVHRFDPVSRTDTEFSAGRMVGALCLRLDGSLLLAAQREFLVLDPERGTLTAGPPAPELAANARFNDGKCDPQGRFWIGSMALDAAFGRGSLFCLDVAGALSTRLQPVTISNGLAWDPLREAMYYVDTATRRIDRFLFDAASGRIADRATAVRVPREMGFPDGMTIDREGMLWVALWGGGAVARFDPQSGECLQVISVPAQHVTSCTFGGENLDQLYITSARDGLTPAQLEEQPLAGALFRARPGARGLIAERYRG